MCMSFGGHMCFFFFFFFLDKYIGVELLDHRVDALKKKKSYPQRETKKLLEVIDVCYIDCDKISQMFQFRFSSVAQSRPPKLIRLYN